VRSAAVEGKNTGGSNPWYQPKFGPAGPENDFTNRNTTFLTWNLFYLARNTAP
jgi:hypothetical protein